MDGVRGNETRPHGRCVSHDTIMNKDHGVNLDQLLFTYKHTNMRTLAKCAYKAHLINLNQLRRRRK